MVLKAEEGSQHTPTGKSVRSLELRRREESGTGGEVDEDEVDDDVLSETASRPSLTTPRPPSKHLAKPSYFRLRELDLHVLSTSPDILNFPPFELIRHLTRPTHTGAEAAYVIFRWVTCQTINSHPAAQSGTEVDPVLSLTLATTVAQLNQGTIDHADLFSHLCRYANLETHKIAGTVRHYTRQPASQLCRLDKACWSAVLLADGWGLVDCALGARFWAQSQRSQSQRSRRSTLPEPQSDPRHDESQQSSAIVGFDTGSIVSSASGVWQKTSASPDTNGAANLPARFQPLEYSPQHFYFLPEPELLVSSHLPDNPSWQLLSHVVTDTDFHEALLLKPHFHYLGVRMLRPTSLRQTDIEEGIEIAWRLKGDNLRRFAFRVFCPDDEELRSEELERYGFLENLHGKGEVRLKLCPPKRGRYSCELYGCYVPARGNQMVHMCSLELGFSRAVPHPLLFPPNERLEWGPGAECAALGLRPLTHELGTVHVDGGQAELAFSCSQPLLATQKLSPAEENEPSVELTGCVVNFLDCRNNLRIFLRLPRPGDYVLRICAKPESSSGRCPLVCAYLVLCDSPLPAHVRPFPPVAYGKVGPTKAFHDFGMRVVCPRSTCLVTCPFSGKVAFVVGCDDPDASELTCELVLHTAGGQPADMTEFVQQSRRGKESVFRSRLPDPGDYVFHLYGRSSEGEGHRFLLYSAIVECSVPCKDSLPLPRISPFWQSRLEILSPLRKYLVKGSVTEFALRVFGVRNVVIVGLETEQHFCLQDDAPGNKSESVQQDGQSPWNDGTEDSGRTHSPPTARNGSTETEDEQDEQAFGGPHETKTEQSGNTDAKTERAAGEKEWQIWRCRVAVGDEQAGSVMKLCIEDAFSVGSYVCVAKFEVITERLMEDTLDHQHQVWTTAEQEARRCRPRSGLQAQATDDAAHASYFRDDEVYVSNPLGDDDSSDDGFTDSSDDQDEDEDEGAADDPDDDRGVDESSDGAEKDKRSRDSGSRSSADEGKRTPVKDSEAKPGQGELSREQTTPGVGKGSATERDSKVTAKTERPSGPKSRSAQVKLIHDVYGSHRRRAPGVKKRTKILAGKQRTKTPDPRVSKEQSEVQHTSSTAHSPDSKVEKSNNGTVMRDPDEANRNEGRRQKMLRRKLWNACQRREREEVERAVARYERGGYPTCADLAEAKRLLLFFQLKDGLTDSIDSKDQDRVRRSLREVELQGFGGDMAGLCQKARCLLAPHSGQSKLPAVAEADMRTLLEIRGYRCPPEVVHHVVISTLLLLGMHEGLTKKWWHCQRRIHVLGPHGIHRKMLTIQPDSVHPEIVARAKVLLEQHTLQEASIAGPGVAAVFRWAMDMITRVEEAASEADSYLLTEDSRNSVQAASRRRQKQIFRQQARQTSGELANDHKGLPASQSKSRGPHTSTDRQTTKAASTSPRKRSASKGEEKKRAFASRVSTPLQPLASKNRKQVRKNPNPSDRRCAVSAATRSRSTERKPAQKETRNCDKPQKSLASEPRFQQTHQGDRHLQQRQQQQEQHQADKQNLHPQRKQVREQQTRQQILQAGQGAHAPGVAGQGTHAPGVAGQGTHAPGVAGQGTHAPGVAGQGAHVPGVAFSEGSTSQSADQHMRDAQDSRPEGDAGNTLADVSRAAGPSNTPPDAASAAEVASATHGRSSTRVGEPAGPEGKEGQQETAGQANSAGSQRSLLSPAESGVSSPARPRGSGEVRAKGGDRPASRSAAGSRRPNPKAPQPVVFHSTFYPISKADDDTSDQHNAYTTGKTS